MRLSHRLALIGIVVVAFLLPPLLARDQVPAGLAMAFTELDRDLVAEFAKDGIGGASIGVVSGARLVWSKQLGYADAESKRVPTNDSAYRIGSITKQFTALALLQLVEQGKMRLTDPLEKFVPEIRSVTGATPGAPPITLLQVGTMMSGLAREPGCANHSVGPVSVWQRKVLECLPQTAYALQPGTQYLYSNIGYASLGLAVERAGGLAYTTLVEQGIFRPLGMTRSSFEPTPEIRKDLAHGYVRRGTAGDRTVPDQKLDGRGYRVPNGAIFSTVNDLSRFVAWEVGEGPAGLLKKETQEANYNRTFSANGALTGGYGLGFQLSRRGDVVMLGHGGSTEGYHAAALVHRSTKLGVIVLRGCDSCAFDAGPVAARILERIVTAVKPVGR